MAAKNLTGQRFGRLVALEDVGSHPTRKQRVRAWLCRCDCGQSTVSASADLIHGRTASCGCLRHELRLARGPVLAAAATTHGQTIGRYRSPEYVTWLSMRQRCSDPAHINFRNYGARGVSVCARWNDSFEVFLADMGPRPSSAHSIDRYPAQGGNYEPGNCRWATREQQGNNRRDNRLVTVGGETLTHSQWARRIGISLHATKVRAAKLEAGEMTGAAFMLPANQAGLAVEVDGVRLPLQAAAAALGITYQALRFRLKAHHASLRTMAEVTAKSPFPGRRSSRSPAAPSV